MPTTVGTKGQVVIEKTIRDRLDVRPGAMAIQTLIGDRVEIRFIPPAHDRSLFGVLRANVGRGIAARPWADVKRKAWEAAAKDLEQAPSVQPPGRGVSQRRARRRRK